METGWQDKQPRIMRAHFMAALPLALSVTVTHLPATVADSLTPGLSGLQGRQLREELARAWAAAVPFMAG